MSISIKALAKTISQLNQARLESTTGSFPLIARLQRHSEKTVMQLCDCWQLLSTIFPQGSKQRHAGADTMDPAEWRQYITKGSRRFLQHHFYQFMEQSVQAGRVEIGGMPSADVVVVCRLL